MEYVGVIIVAALAFGLFYLMDKAYTKVFRSQSQHLSGKSVRLNKRYGTIGLVMAIFGLVALFAGLGTSLLLIICGSLILLVGIALIVYYMTFGIFYDDDTFLVTTFGKRSKTHSYGEITGQQLYNNAGTTLIELFLEDGSSIQLQENMPGACEFMDFALEVWLRQKDKTQEECDFCNPDNSCWFPEV